MIIIVQGANDGHDGRYRARRYWPNAEPRRVEVVETKDGIDPPDIAIKRPDGSMVMGPDPDRIGRKSFEELRGDICIRILADGETQGAASHAALAAAKKLATDAQAAANDAQVSLAEANERIALIETENADLRAQLAKATGGQAAASDAPPAGDSPDKQAPANAKGSSKK
jgi:uncharacterized small protein (DUF1192 family)